MSVAQEQIPVLLTLFALTVLASTAAAVSLASEMTVAAQAEHAQVSKLSTPCWEKKNCLLQKPFNLK